MRWVTAIGVVQDGKAKALPDQRLGRRRARRRHEGDGERDERSERYLMKRISAYFGSGHRSSGTMPSSRSATSRTAAIAGSTVSRM